MSRWNNGFVRVENGKLLSVKSLPQDAPNNLKISGYDNYSEKQEQRKRVLLTRGRFTSPYASDYSIGNAQTLEHLRGASSLPFVDYPEATFSAGGDLRDLNSLGGGMPENRQSIGNGIPGRKSVFSRNLSLRLDHESPVRRS